MVIVFRSVRFVVMTVQGALERRLGHAWRLRAVMEGEMQGMLRQDHPGEAPDDHGQSRNDASRGAQWQTLLAHWQCFRATWHFADRPPGPNN